MRPLFQLNPKPLLFVSSLCVGIVSLASFASARECAQDDDCPKGYLCEEVGSSTCPTVDCPDVEGAECPEPEPCEPETISECVAGPCESDDDCDDGMVCFTESHEVCDTPACPTDEDCKQDASDCSEETQNRCIPRYLADCEDDADCGMGFSCEELEACGCSGSSGSVEPGSTGADPADGDRSNDAGSVDAEPLDGGMTTDNPAGGDTASEGEDGSCSCEPTGNFYCKLIEQDCEQDGDCPTDFSCEENPSGTVCSGGGAVGAPSDVGTTDEVGANASSSSDEPSVAESGPDGGSIDGIDATDPEASCQEPEPSKVCLPPYWDLGDGRDYGGGSGSNTSGEGDSGQGTSGGTDSTGEPNGNTSSDTDEEPNDGDKTEAKSGGCALSTPGSGAPLGGLSVMMATGLAWLTRRRR